jgi:hyperosmotically inducible periplasmic protein
MRVPKTITALALVGALAATQVGANEDGELAQAIKDGWIDGRLEAVYALNRHLNPFAINTDVDQGVVHLTGTVESDIDRDLAVELAKGIDGVVEVRNDLEVEAGSARSQDAQADGPERSFGTWVDDATTTAAIKTKLVGNSNTSGLQIKVETHGDVVTLSGTVASDQERQLAEEIARNTGDVRDVRNELVVDRG